MYCNVRLRTSGGMVGWTASSDTQAGQVPMGKPHSIVEGIDSPLHGHVHLMSVYVFHHMSHQASSSSLESK